MQHGRIAGCRPPYRPAWLAISLTVLAPGCVSTGVAGSGGGVSLARAECAQNDSTVACCLKQNPGQHERCGAVLPVDTPRPTPLSPELPKSEAVPIPDLPTQAERERWNKDICRPHYAKCIRASGDAIDGRKWGETQCQACYDACMRHGFWPWQANDKPCPGA